MPDLSIYLEDVDPQVIAEQLNERFRSRPSPLPAQSNPDMKLRLYATLKDHSYLDRGACVVEIRAQGYNEIDALYFDRSINPFAHDLGVQARIRLDPVEGGWQAEPQDIHNGSAPIAGLVMARLREQFGTQHPHARSAPAVPNSTTVVGPDTVTPTHTGAALKSGLRLSAYIQRRKTWLYIKPFVGKKGNDLPELLNKINNNRSDLTCCLKTLGKIRADGQRGMLDLDPQDFPP